MNANEIKIKITKIASRVPYAIDLLPLLVSIDQLEADAELGRAVRYLASNHISIPMQYMNDYITDETIEYIVKTAKKIVENS